ncbi:MAG TPA: hypothetical protein VHK45_04895 [Geminicoccaceae bacterium]|jgi:hypothetical protein|nr:hypothetical protein [Geminicoccaceae bacterium]
MPEPTATTDAVSPAALTICTVSFDSWGWLVLHMALARRLAPEAELHWVVADNAPGGARPALPAGVDVRVVPGAPFPDRPYAAGGYHHGAGLNATLAHVRTRHALFLDPDFFVVRPHWPGGVLAHMEERGLAFFGAPWHPRWVYKVRYFPCAHCLFVDGARVPLAALDFRPDYEEVPAHARRKEALPLRGRALRHALGIIDPLRLRKRRLVATSRDTSWRIYDRYAQDPARPSECLQPVFDPGRTRALEVLLPDRLRLVPGRPGYFARAGFAARGLPDLAALGCEEFLWRDAPFGFHVRSQPKRKVAGTVEHHQARLAGILDDIAPRNGRRSRPADVDAQGLR